MVNNPFWSGIALFTLACVGGACVAGACIGRQASSPAPEQARDPSWADRESWCLTDHVQLTSAADYLKAGESYFSPDGNMVIFQAVPRPPEGVEPDSHYGMYVAPVVRSPDGAVTGLGDATRISEPGSASTCGWFHPTDYTPDAEYTVLFGTTTTPPDEAAASGYQRGTSRYTWQFPNEMEVVSGEVGVITYETSTSVEIELPLIGRTTKSTTETEGRKPTARQFAPLWTRDGYDAEASWSPDGRHILYTRLEPGSSDGDLWVYDTTSETHTELVAQPGYDGGPFFSPDGTRICYRSDRRGDKALQLFIAELAFDGTGAVTGIAREIPITDNQHVNWAPFFTPDGSMLFYATSEVSHSNYEIFATDAGGDTPPDERPRVRITDAGGFDGLPVFSPDASRAGLWMMWTAQRGPRADGEDRPSSQLWAARIDLGAVKARLNAQSERIQDEKLQERFDEFMPGG